MYVYFPEIKFKGFPCHSRCPMSWSQLESLTRLSSWLVMFSSVLLNFHLAFSPHIAPLLSQEWSQKYALYEFSLSADRMAPICSAIQGVWHIQDILLGWKGQKIKKGRKTGHL